MSNKIDIPECVKRFAALVYPDTNIDRLTFHEGLPFYVFGRRNAITLGAHIYFNEDRFDPCTCRGTALIAHELYHVHQGSAGFGFWVFRWFYIKYAMLWFTSGFKTRREHPLEVPAYDLSDRVGRCCQAIEQRTGQSGPCVCEDGRPTGANDEFLRAFAEECPDLLSRETND